MTSALNLDTVDAGEDFTNLFFTEADAPQQAAPQDAPAISLGSDLSAILAGEADPEDVKAAASTEGTTSIEHLLDQDSDLLEEHMKQQSDVEKYIAEETEREAAAAAAVKLASEEAAREQEQKQAAEDAAAAEKAAKEAAEEQERLAAEQQAQIAAQKKAE